MHKTRARDMRRIVSAAPGWDIREIVAAIEYDPVRIVDMSGEFGNCNEGGEHQDSGFGIRDSAGVGAAGSFTLNPTFLL